MNPLIVSGIIIAIGVSFFLLATRKRNVVVTSGPNQDTLKPKETRLDKNPYTDLRNQALNVTTAQLGLDIDSNLITVYGTITDLDIGPAIVTIVAFKTGDASVYLSSGQMFIGGVTKEKIRAAALKLVDEAQQYLSKVKLSDSKDLPNKQNVKFTFLTNKGKYVHEESLENVESEKSEWSKLFYLANDIVTEYRLIDQNR